MCLGPRHEKACMLARKGLFWGAVFFKGPIRFLVCVERLVGISLKERGRSFRIVPKRGKLDLGGAGALQEGRFG